VVSDEIQDTIEVGIAQLAVARAPTQIVCHSLGSCVALILYDSRLRVGGLAHVMLPNSNSSSPSTPAKSADQAVEALLEAMAELGARRRCLTAKLVGGATLFKPQDENIPTMGSRNVAALKEHLERNHLPLLAADTGGDFARTVTFSTQEGIVKIRTLTHGEYEI